VIASAQALRLVLDLVSGERRWFATSLPMPRPAIKSAMNLVARHIRSVTERALEAAQSPASCRLSFTLYTSIDDIERAMDALRRVAAGAGGRAGASAAAAMNPPP